MTEKMKPSGIAWIGDVPQSWKISRLKYNVTCLDERRIPVDAALRNPGPYPYWGAGSIVDYVDNYIFDEELVLLGEDGAPFFDKYRPVAFLIAEKIWANNHIHVIKGKPGICNRFLVHYLNSVEYREYINGSILNKLTQGNMNEIVCPIPSDVEQEAIADFLDSQCAKIDGVIADIEKQIEILQKYKKSLITEAVTKGLKPDIPMRSSKVEYVSSVPDHWEEKRLNIVAYVRARLGWRGLTADEYVDEGYAFLSAFNIVDDKLDLSEELLNYITKFRYDESPEIKLHSGDVLLVKDGAGLGKCARIDDLPFETAPNGSLAVITPNEQLHYRYLYYFFVGDVFQQRINQIKNGMGVPHLPQGDLRKIVVPIPPMGEQIAISDYLDERCAIVDPLIEEKEKQLETMKQHKKSLIYEYVTGKKRVTEVN